MKKEFDFKLFILRIKRRFWNIVFHLTRVPYLNDIAGRKELETMKKIIDRSFDIV